MLMQNECYFSNAVKNPYPKKLKKQITINIDSSTNDYFKSLADKSGVPYQTLIKLYLADCAEKKKVIAWV